MLLPIFMLLLSGAPVPDRTPSGYATVECAIGDRNNVSNCRVVAESPPGQGFGRAALQIARRLRPRPEDVGEDGAFRSTIRFGLCNTPDRATRLPQAGIDCGPPAS
jgi:TonB family protein